MNDKIYDLMYDSVGHDAEITTVDGKTYSGHVIGVESRFDNEDDDNEWAGTGSLLLERKNGDHRFFYEGQIKDIKITD